MSKKVLIVDDEESAVKYLSVVLEENGYQAIGAHDGREGLDKARQERPDLIVLDVMMPRRTGFSMFKQLKRDENLCDVPVMMITAVAASLEELDAEAEDTFARPFDSLRESLRQTIREMREEGEVRPDMFIDKPVDPDAFVARVKSLIGD
jgi:two-component system alkaline phosphatase synthesis response regulator PhoP